MGTIWDREKRVCLDKSRLRGIETIMRIGSVIGIAFAGMMLVASLAGCGGGGGGSSLPDPIVRFVNASPDSNPLDFFINTDKKAAALAYVNTSPEVMTKKGDHDISAQDSTNQIVQDDIAFTFAQDNKYIAMTAGLENFGAENLKRLRLIAFQFDKNPPNGSQARLLIMHCYMRAPGFDTPSIDFQGGAVGSYDPNNPQFASTNIGFAAAQPAVLSVDSGIPLIFQARRASTENVLASDASTTFDQGGIYLAIVSGVENAVGVEAPQVKYIKLNP